MNLSPNSLYANSLLIFDRKGEMCTSAEGRQMQRRVWKEITDVLQSKAGLAVL